MKSTNRRGAIGGSFLNVNSNDKPRESTMSRRKSRVFDMASTVKMAAIMSSLNKKERIFKQKLNQIMRKNKPESGHNIYN